jgi:hypothetical protein
MDEILHDLVALVLAGILDLIEFSLGLVVGVILGLLEAARVLPTQQ